jgi:hypothetical protein
MGKIPRHKILAMWGTSAVLSLDTSQDPEEFDRRENLAGQIKMAYLLYVSCFIDLTDEPSSISHMRTAFGRD